MKLCLPIAFLFFAFIPQLAAADERPPNEISLLLVNQTGDISRAGLLGGASYTRYFNSTIWIGADLMLGPIQLDEDLSSDVQKNDLFQFFLGTFYINLPAALGRDPKEQVLADLYTSFSLGAVLVGDHISPAGSIGGGLLARWPYEWLHLRFDLKGLFYTLDNANGPDFSADLVLSLGPSFVF